MLKIEVAPQELFNEKTMEFTCFGGGTLLLEHSLISVSKWESKWHVPFIREDSGGYSNEEILDYIRCMTINSNVDPDIYNYLTVQNIKDVVAYINDPMTATTFSSASGSGGGPKQIVTSELIYYWMVALQIPVEFQKWHLSRLLTLIRICNIKNKPAEKMNTRQIYDQNRKLNEARRKAMNSKG